MGGDVLGQGQRGEAPVRPERDHPTGAEAFRMIGWSTHVKGAPGPENHRSEPTAARGSCKTR